MHHPHLADYFEDFTRPYTSQHQSSANGNPPSNYFHHHGTTTGANGHPVTVNVNMNVTYGATGSNPGSIPSYLPIEDIYVPPQYQPPNPEDEDDVIPVQHAAFGITKAMERKREVVWRDLGLEELVRGRTFGAGSGVRGGRLEGGNKDGKIKRDVGLRVKDAGGLMGGRRTICLR